jgi:hypothetical protein
MGCYERREELLLTVLTLVVTASGHMVSQPCRRVFLEPVISSLFKADIVTNHLALQPLMTVDLFNDFFDQKEFLTIDLQGVILSFQVELMMDYSTTASRFVKQFLS